MFSPRDANTPWWSSEHLSEHFNLNSSLPASNPQLSPPIGCQRTLCGSVPRVAIPFMSLDPAGCTVGAKQGLWRSWRGGGGGGGYDTADGKSSGRLDKPFGSRGASPGPLVESDRPN